MEHDADDPPALHQDLPRDPHRPDGGRGARSSTTRRMGTVAPRWVRYHADLTASSAPSRSVRDFATRPSRVRALRRFRALFRFAAFLSPSSFSRAFSAAFSFSAACAAARRAIGIRNGRAGDVVELRPVAELHARRLAAVLAADADLQLRPRRRGPSSTPHRHQLADAALVQLLERVGREDLAPDVLGEELPGVVAARARTSSASGRSCRS